MTEIDKALLIVNSFDLGLRSELDGLLGRRDREEERRFDLLVFIFFSCKPSNVNLLLQLDKHKKVLPVLNIGIEMKLA